MSWALAAVVFVGAVVAANPSTARACQWAPAPWLRLELPKAAVQIPVDGVFAFNAQSVGELPEVFALLSVEVSLDGQPIDGTIEVIVRHEYDDPAGQGRMMLVV